MQSGRRRGRMASPRRGLLAGALLLGWVSAANAQSWQRTYDASLGSLPSAQGWSLSTVDPAPDDSLDEGNYLVSLGALTQGDTGGGSTDASNIQYYEIPLPGVDFDRDAIQVDLRLKILSSTSDPPLPGPPEAGFELFVEDDDGEFVRIYFGETGVMLYDFAVPSATTLAAFDTTADFADYRLRIDPDGASLAVNGTEVATLERDRFDQSFLYVTDRAGFGDLSGLHRSSSQIESVVVSRSTPTPPEVRHYESDWAGTASDSTDSKTLTVPCPGGLRALTGGVETIGAASLVGISESRPSGTPPSGWTGSAREVTPTSDPWELRVYVVCGSLPGYDWSSETSPADTDAEQYLDPACPAESPHALGGGGRFIGSDEKQMLVRGGRSGAGLAIHGATTSASPWSIQAWKTCSATPSNQTLDTGATPPNATNPQLETLQCPNGKVPVGSSLGLQPTAIPDRLFRYARPTLAGPGFRPDGWTAEAQMTSTLWRVGMTLECSPLADPTVSKTGLVGRWQGEGDADDSWGSGDGTLEGGLSTFAPAVLGDGFVFDGVSEEWVEIEQGAKFVGPVRVADGVWLYPDGSFSADAWIIADPLAPGATYSHIVGLYEFGGFGSNPNASAWSIGLTAEGYAQVAVRTYPTSNNFSASVVGTTPLDDGQRHHIALVRDLENGVLEMWVDGELIGADGLIEIQREELRPTDSQVPDPVTIGGRQKVAQAGVELLFDGIIDDVKYWDRALRKEEIQNIAGCGLPILPRVLNLDARDFGSRLEHDHGLCVFLEAGTYNLTLVDPASDPDARFTAWSPSDGSPWGTRFQVQPEVDASFAFGLAPFAADPDAAFAGTSTKDTQLVLSQAQRVEFSITEDVLLDNVGGVSVRVELDLEACQDGIDNDGDGLIDFAGGDPGCDSPTDLSETSTLLPCDDGDDNDGDGRTDFDPATFADVAGGFAAGTGDPGCKSPDWSREDPACQDALDNDSYAGIDFDGGASLNGGIPITGPDPQCQDKPWRLSEAASCGLGAEIALVLVPFLAVWEWRRRRLAAG